jgi:hypothetical protein
MSDLLQNIQDTFPSILNGHLAARLGVGINSTKRALKSAVPVMLSALAIAAANDATRVYDLCQQVRPVRTDVTGILVMFGSRDATDSAPIQGDHLMKAAFSGSQQLIISTIADYAKMQPALVCCLLELVGTAMLGAVGKYAVQHELTAEDTATKLVGLKARTKALLPAELAGLTALLGLRSILHRNMSPTAAAYALVWQAAVRRPRAGWYLAAMLLVLVTGAAALGALTLEHSTQQAAETATPQAVQIEAKVTSDNSSALHTNF